MGLLAPRWLDHFEAKTGAFGERLLGMDQHGPDDSSLSCAYEHIQRHRSGYTPSVPPRGKFSRFLHVKVLEIYTN